MLPEPAQQQIERIAGGVGQPKFPGSHLKLASISWQQVEWHPAHQQPADDGAYKQSQLSVQRCYGVGFDHGCCLTDKD
jgi:hypothetical protein